MISHNIFRQLLSPLRGIGGQIVLYIAIPFVIVISLLTCKQQELKESKQNVVSLDDGAVAVTLVDVEDVKIAIPVLGSGLVGTKHEARLAFKIGGIVKNIFVKEGQSVSKGQLLASLDLTEIEAQVNQAKNNVEKLKRDMDRVQRLYKDSAATLEMVQNIKTAYDVAVESKTIAEFNREYATIKATSSGKILKRFLNEGELTASGTPMFMLNSAGQNEWIIKLAVPDLDWARLKLGDKTQIKIDALGSETMSGEVSLIGEGADPFTGLYPIEVSISKTFSRLASGLFASVEIIPSKSLSLKKIPIETLVEGTERNAFVFVLLEDRKHVRKSLVNVAHIQKRSVFVSSGLEGVDEIVLSGSGFLTEGSVVHLTP